MSLDGDAIKRVVTPKSPPASAGRSIVINNAGFIRLPPIDDDGFDAVWDKAFALCLLRRSNA